MTGTAIDKVGELVMPRYGRGGDPNWFGTLARTPEQEHLPVPLIEKTEDISEEATMAKDRQTEITRSSADYLPELSKEQRSENASKGFLTRALSGKFKLTNLPTQSLVRLHREARKVMKPYETLIERIEAIAREKRRDLDQLVAGEKVE